MTDIWRSTIKQLVLARKFEPRKSSADEKLATSKPTESMNPLRASRTDSSSSTIVTRLVVETASFTALYPWSINEVTKCHFFLDVFASIALQNNEEGMPSSFTCPITVIPRSHLPNDAGVLAAVRGLDLFPADLHHTARKSR